MIFGCKNILKKHAEQILLTFTVYSNNSILNEIKF